MATDGPYVIHNPQRISLGEFLRLPKQHRGGSHNWRDKGPDGKWRLRYTGFSFGQLVEIIYPRLIVQVYADT